MPNGEIGYYDKRHLFAYGEEDKHYTAGNKHHRICKRMENKFTGLLRPSVPGLGKANSYG